MDATRVGLAVLPAGTMMSILGVLQRFRGCSSVEERERNRAGKIWKAERRKKGGRKRTRGPGVTRTNEKDSRCNWHEYTGDSLRNSELNEGENRTGPWTLILICIAGLWKKEFVQRMNTTPRRIQENNYTRNLKTRANFFLFAPGGVKLRIFN